MSALPPIADIERASAERPLMTQSGHSLHRLFLPESANPDNPSVFEKIARLHFLGESSQVNPNGLDWRVLQTDS